MLIHLLTRSGVKNSHTHTMLTAKQTRVDVHQLIILMSHPSLETSESSSHVNTLEHRERHHRSYAVEVEDVTGAYLHCKLYYVDY